jgi:hypothetical protein
MMPINNIIPHRSVTQSINFNKVLAGRFSNKKITLPLNGRTPYIQFKHVQGISHPGKSGYSISKLQMIDNLIENLLVETKKLPAAHRQIMKYVGNFIPSGPGQKLNLLL